MCLGAEHADAESAILPTLCGHLLISQRIGAAQKYQLISGEFLLTSSWAIQCCDSYISYFTVKAATTMQISKRNLFAIRVLGAAGVAALAYAQSRGSGFDPFQSNVCAMMWFITVLLIGIYFELSKA